jgi:uncharacterized protein involved in exopolysaccharide biosynthesis
VPVSNVHSDPLTPPDAGGPQDGPPLSEISLVELMSGVLRHRYLIMRTALVGAVLAVVVGAIRPNTYSSFAALMPQTSKPSNAIAGLATQFGFSLPASDPGQTPAFYSDLIESAQLLSSLASSRFPDPKQHGAERPLVDILEAEGATPAARLNDAVLILRKHIDPSIRPKTGVVNVAVHTEDPQLSAAICVKLLELLNQFNLETRQSQAAAEAKFVQARLADAKASLRVGEDRLQAFLERNREFRSSSELSFQEERLRRDVMLSQQIVSTLAQSYEQARIDQVRDTPAITIVERPVPPPEPDRRHYARRALIGLVLGLVLGVLWAWVRDLLLGLSRRPDPEIEEFQFLLDDSAAELRRPWRILGRIFLPRRRRTSA